MEYWYLSCSEIGLSQDVAQCSLRSIGKETLVGYQRNWRKFATWCGEREIGYGKISVDVICRYLLYLFDLGMKSGFLNSVRSSISFFTQHSSLNLGSDKTVARIFKYFYKERPKFPRYLVTWDVGKVLKFLARWHP